MRDKAKVSAYNKEYRARNREKIAASKKKFREENQDKINERNRAARRENPARSLCHKAKYRSSKLGVPFDLTVEDIVVPKFCPYLHVALEVGDGVISPNSPSLDRIVPELGYVKGNVQVISQLANSMKQNATVEQLHAFADAVKRLHPLPQPSENGTLPTPDAQDPE